jgi:hypothetical protein
LLYARPGIFKKIDGYIPLISNKTIEYLTTYKTPGMPIYDDMSSVNRIGAFFVVSKTKRELIEKIHTAIKMIEIYNMEGESIMKKEIFINLK